MEKFKIKTCIFIGNSRSGTHAVNAWILDQWNIESFDNRLKVRGIFQNTKRPKKEKNKRHLLKKIAKNKRHLLTQMQMQIQMHQNNMLVFESRPLDEVEACIKWLSQHDIEYEFVFVLLRDPFNWLSSFVEYVKMFHKRYSTRRHFLTEIEYWKTYALQFSEPRIKNTLCISYNSWFSSKEYRKILSKKIGGHFSDSRIDHQGSRSSFPNDQMRVLDRWKEMHDNKKFRSLIKDPELLLICKDIFGETEAYKHFNKREKDAPIQETSREYS